jgi:hypothetical protein
MEMKLKPKLVLCCGRWRSGLNQFIRRSTSVGVVVTVMALRLLRIRPLRLRLMIATISTEAMCIDEEVTEGFGGSFMLRQCMLR